MTYKAVSFLNRHMCVDERLGLLGQDPVPHPYAWQGSDAAVAALVRLLIIDEVHLLNDERGPVIETLVARTQRQVWRYSTCAARCSSTASACCSLPFAAERACADAGRWRLARA